MNCPHCNIANPDDARFCASCGKATSATEPVSNPGLRPMPDPIGKEIAGRYRIVSKLGEGGMGAVYKAEQISLKRTCAVKVLRPDVAGTAIMLRRFNAEAENIAKLSHPNIVNVYDFGQDTDGTFFIAMEFVEGKSLREVIHAEAPLPHRRALAIAMQVATSLVEAHSHQIIHRDLKPDNVMLQSRGRAKDVVRVLDFGIAKLRDEGRATQAAMTQAGDMLGTPQYMAPEQIRAEQIDGRTDIYALGCMLYEMITARLPFEAPTLMALLSKHLTEPPQKPSQRRPDLGIPPFIDDVVMLALAKDPNARPPTMEAYGEQLARAMAMLPPDANASAPMSAVQPAMSGAAIGVATPPSAYGGYTPPPQYPTPAPPPYPPPPGPVPGYGTPQAAYSPYAQPPHTQPIAPPKKGMPVIAMVLIAVLLIGGAGAGVFLATRGGDDDKQEVATADDAGIKDDPTVADAKQEEPIDKPPVTADAAVEEPDDDNDPVPHTDDDDHGSAKDPWSGGANEMVTKMAEYKKRACLCLDAKCAAKVAEDMGKWSLDIAKRFDATKMDTAQTQKVAELGAQYAECMKKASTLVAKKPPPVQSLNQQLDVLANRACACRDAGCGRRVLNDFAAFVRRNKYAQGGDEKKAEASGKRLGMCLVTAGVDQDELMRVLQSL